MGSSWSLFGLLSASEEKVDAPPPPLTSADLDPLDPRYAAVRVAEIRAQRGDWRKNKNGAVKKASPELRKMCAEAAAAMNCDFDWGDADVAASPP